MKILLAEDEMISRRMLERDLKKLGYEVHGVANGKDAWDQFQEQRHPIVISDWEMPEMSGIELVKRIRGLPGEEYVYLVLLTSRTAKKDLIEGMEAGADDFIAKPFELEELRVRLRAGQRIIEMERSLARQKNELEDWKTRVQKDLRAAAVIQQAFLPVFLPIVSGMSFSWNYQPCEELGGDMLNVIRLDEDHVGIYVLDVSGHGVRAALLSVTLSHVLGSGSGSMLKTASDEAHGSRIVAPAAVAAGLNERFAMSEKTEQYFTLFYGVLHVPTRELRYVLAGHPSPVYLANNSEPALLPGGGLPIGVDSAAEFEEHQLLLRVGDRLIAYSDGVTDLEGVGGQRLGKARLMNALAGWRNSSSDATISSIVQMLEQWRADHPVQDDMSLIALAML
jgi:sigma-B regulation protein RsbU (phosphoserine phosphatase)